MSPPGLASDRHGVQQREVDKFKAQILQDVGIRLQQAKQETERKVSAEKYLHVAMQEMDQRLDSLNKRLEDVPMLGLIWLREDPGTAGLTQEG
eukprot:g17446.t1